MPDIAIEQNDDISKIIDKMLGKDWKTKSELSQEEINTISIILTTVKRIDKNHGIKLTNIVTLIDDYLQLKISFKRKSRSETVRAISAELAQGPGGDEIENDAAKKFGRLF